MGRRLALQGMTVTFLVRTWRVCPSLIWAISCSATETSGTAVPMHSRPQLEHRYSGGLMLNVSYTYLDQKSSGLDTGNSSLGVSPTMPSNRIMTTGKKRSFRKIALWLTAYTICPWARERDSAHHGRHGQTLLLGGWQTTFNMFAKTGTGFTPFWLCDNCGPALPGNVAVTSLDAYGDFNAEPSYRPIVVGNFNHRNGNQIWDPNAFEASSLWRRRV